MSDLSERKTARKVARNNARRALTRIQEELRVLVRNSPNYGKDGPLSKLMLGYAEIGAYEIARYMYDIDIKLEDEDGKLGS